ncbi:unnamed protein product [Blepharisma stoltei]|uniref:Zinc finger CHCC-type domain-containing protein n=1 Tax=Blepharisma stoltei TaxID=1481888 RepID=A0AAU9KFS5_9CILI|nr:unnamed protein product [Blepharisma stoltei]
MKFFTKYLQQISKFGEPSFMKDIDGNPVDITQPHQASKLTHLTNGEEWIWKMSPILVDDDIVRCTGVKTIGLGHPMVYILLNKVEQNEPEVCKWCGLRYRKNPLLNQH